MVPQRSLLAHFEATHDFSVFDLLTHNNITISYCGQVNSLRLKSSVASKWADKQLWKGGPFILLVKVHNYF